jgi:hypothetical protein
MDGQIRPSYNNQAKQRGYCWFLFIIAVDVTVELEVNNAF